MIVTLSVALLPASSKALIVYTYFTLFVRPLSSKLEARPVNTGPASGPFGPGVRSISIDLVSAEAFQVRVAEPSSQSTPTLVIFGGVESYLKEGEVPLARFPALSEHDPLTVVPLVSGPLYETSVHESMPEPPSLPWNVTRTGWLYQPSLSGARSSVTLEMVGADAS